MNMWGPPMIDRQLVNEVHEVFNRNHTNPDTARMLMEKLIGGHGAYAVCAATIECALVAYARTTRQNHDKNGNGGGQ